jgi:hypothetical protein
MLSRHPAKVFVWLFLKLVLMLTSETIATFRRKCWQTVQKVPPSEIISVADKRLGVEEGSPPPHCGNFFRGGRSALCEMLGVEMTKTLQKENPQHTKALHDGTPRRTKHAHDEDSQYRKPAHGESPQYAKPTQRESRQSTGVRKT